MHTLLLAWQFWTHLIREPLWNPYGAMLAPPVASYVLQQLVQAWRNR